MLEDIEKAYKGARRLKEYYKYLKKYKGERIEIISKERKRINKDTVNEIERITEGTVDKVTIDPIKLILSDVKQYEYNRREKVLFDGKEIKDRMVVDELENQKKDGGKGEVNLDDIKSVDQIKVKNQNADKK